MTATTAAGAEALAASEIPSSSLWRIRIGSFLVPVAHAAGMNVVTVLGLRYLTETVVGRLSPGGTIVNFASILGAAWPERLAQHKDLARTATFQSGHDWLAAYPVSQDTCYQYFKEALIVWTFMRAQQLFLSCDIRMNSVAPGPVFTPILGDFITMLGQDRVEADSVRMKRPAFADEIAPAVVFLCSDAARWINGVNLPIDGGLASTYL